MFFGISYPNVIVCVLIQYADLSLIEYLDIKQTSYSSKQKAMKANYFEIPPSQF